MAWKLSALSTKALLISQLARISMFVSVLLPKIVYSSCGATFILMHKAKDISDVYDLHEIFCYNYISTKPELSKYHWQSPKECNLSG